MKNILKSLFSTEFIIDEPKEDVYVPSKTDKQDKADDLISLVSDVILENDRLPWAEIEELEAELAEERSRDHAAAGQAETQTQ